MEPLSRKNLKEVQQRLMVIELMNYALVYSTMTEKGEN
jgi:hypothetical protein